MTTKVKHWQDPLCIIAGLWMVASPWALAYAAEPRPMWNAVIVGALIALVALYTVFRLTAWKEWANVVLGLWLIASPWILGFSGLTAAAFNAVIVGALVALLSFMVLATDRDVGGWFSAAH